MTRFSIKYYHFLFFVVVLASACKKDSTNNPTPVSHIGDATNYDASVAINWINEFRDIAKTQPLNPPRASRMYAYAGIALYESVVDGIKGNKSLQGQLNGFPLNSIPSNIDSLDYGIVVNEALFAIAKCDTIIPTLTAQNLMNCETLHMQFLATKTSVVADSIIAKSKARGILVANAIMKYAATDNFLAVKTLIYTLPPRDAAHPWYWEPTDASHLNPVEPFWGQIRPFVMDSSAQFEIPQSVNFSDDTSSAFGHQALEVYNTVNNRTNAQNDIVLWWRDATGTQTPAGHWMGILQYIIHQKGFKLGNAAELYALTGISTAEAFVACWKSKYKFNLLRPETYIIAYINSGWSTGQGSDPTPPFPEYPSGHSVCSGAADKALTNYLGSFTFTDSVNVVLFGYNPRTFTSFTAAANEAGISRLYGGIHYIEAIQNGLIEGRNIGQFVTDKINFK